eukprot:s1622_g5.t1
MNQSDQSGMGSHPDKLAGIKSNPTLIHVNPHDGINLLDDFGFQILPSAASWGTDYDMDNYPVIALSPQVCGCSHCTSEST